METNYSTNKASSLETKGGKRCLIFTCNSQAKTKRLDCCRRNFCKLHSEQYIYKCDCGFKVCHDHVDKYGEFEDEEFMCNNCLQEFDE